MMKLLSSFPIVEIIMIFVGAKLVYDSHFGVSREIELLQEKAIAANPNKKKDQHRADQIRRERFAAIAILVAGIIGLLLHFL